MVDRQDVDLVDGLKAGEGVEFYLRPFLERFIFLPFADQGIIEGGVTHVSNLRYLLDRLGVMDDTEFSGGNE